MRGMLGAQNGHRGRTVVAPANVVLTSRHRCHGVLSARRARSFGDTEGWDRVYADPQEVYLFRVVAENAPIDTPEDALRFLRAVATHQKLKLDVRGVTIGYLADGRPQIDVVFTADTHIPYLLPTTASEMTAALLADEHLRGRYPELVLQNGAFLELVGPPDAIDFWRSQAPVWDDQVGPTDAFAKAQGVYQGSSDDGPRAKPWSVTPPGLEDKDEGRPGALKLPWAFWAFGGAIATAFAAHLLFSSKGLP